MASVLSYEALGADWLIGTAVADEFEGRGVLEAELVMVLVLGLVFGGCPSSFLSSRVIM